MEGKDFADYHGETQHSTQTQLKTMSGETIMIKTSLNGTIGDVTP